SMLVGSLAIPEERLHGREDGGEDAYGARRDLPEVGCRVVDRREGGGADDGRRDDDRDPEREVAPPRLVGGELVSELSPRHPEMPVEEERLGPRSPLGSL